MKFASLAALMMSLGLMDAIEHVPDIIEEVTDLVEELDLSDLSGKEKFKFATREVAIIIDDHCDWLPGWKTLSEQARDRIVGGFVELAVQISRKARGGKKKVSSFRQRFIRLQDRGAASIKRR